jgi:hypothetical protein
VAVAVLTVACSAGGEPDTGSPDATPGSTAAAASPPGTGGGASGTTAGTAGPGGTPNPSVPIVDPASVEAFCALDEQLDQLAAEQLAPAGTADPEALRAAFARFLADNEAVIDQYTAAAPPEIEADVDASMAQTRAAVDDPARFQEALAGSDASRRVSAFLTANCT